MKSFLKFSPAMTLAVMLLPSQGIAQPGAVNPPMLDCGTQGEAEIICGTRAPEDFEVTPDGDFLIVAKFGEVVDQSLDLFNLATQSFSALPLSDGRQQGWGMDECTDSIGAQVSAHGLSLSQRASGEWQLYVVNHNVRESVEMYELQQEGDAWQLVWRGCVLAEQPYNDVAALPDGGFVATRPTALVTQGQDIFAGAPTGNVAVWSEPNGEYVLPGSEYGYPNGVIVSADGRHAFISSWTTRGIHKYDLLSSEEVGSADLTFMPDNLTWTPDGNILAAGILGVSGNCPASSSDPCIQGMLVAEIDADTLDVSIVHDSDGEGLINGTSVAIEANGAIYVGSFQGERLVKLPR